MKDLSKQLPNNLAGKIKKNVRLANFSTFKIGGPVSFFITANCNKNIVKIIQLSKKNSIPYLILGKGSNLLVSDKGFAGIAIKIATKGLKCEDTKIIGEAGVSLAKIVQVAQKKGLSGLEFAIGIPGTIGGAIRGNAGAFSQAIDQTVEEVLVLNSDGQEEQLSAKECHFAYRDSVFKSSRTNDVILQASLRLKKGSGENIKLKMQENLKKRLRCQWPSAGCIFKNPSLPYSVAEFAKKGLDPSKITLLGKIPAAYLIDQLDLKGKRIGGAMVAQINANYIVNVDRATAEDVVILIGIIKQKVRDNYGIQLQEEVQYVGF